MHARANTLEEPRVYIYTYVYIHIHTQTDTSTDYMGIRLQHSGLNIKLYVHDLRAVGLAGMIAAPTPL